MGPKANVSVEAAVDALKKYIKYFIPPEKPKWSAKVWRLISDELDNKWNESAVRTNVNNNRRNILTIALKDCGYYSDETNTKSSTFNDNNNDDDDDDDEEVKDKNIDNSDSDEVNYDNDPDYYDQAYFNDTAEIEEFDVEICRDLWNKIITASTDNNNHKNLKLNNRVWTDIIAFAFWEQYRLKCAFVFDKGRITVNGNNFLTIQAHCKSKICGNRLLGYLEDIPSEEGPVFIKIKCSDTRFAEKHENCRRPLQSETRNKVSKELKDLGVHGYTRKAGTKLLRPGNTGCPFLYKPEVLRQAKKQFIDHEHGIKPIDRKDIFAAIDRLNVNPMYKNAIIMMGKPFFVYYATQSQMHCYREYRRLHKKFSSICIDATGGVVRKIVSGSQKSAYIFLYQIVINFNKTSLSVYQMLTEMQDADNIALWLKKWLRVVKPPHEAVSDGSRAQLNAMSSAFNDMSLKQYVKLCFENLKTHQENTDIKTYIRLDVAHFVHTITGWSCFKSVLHSSVKKFFTYCLCLLIDCTSLKKFERILLLILIICNVAYEDSIVDVNDEEITPLIAKSELEDLISHRNVVQYFANVTEEIAKLNIDPDTHTLKNTSLHSSEKDSLSISTWMNNILNVSKNVIYQGEKLNSFFLPTLEKPLVEAAMEFPLWTNICIPHSDLRATSSYIEEDFKDLKMALGRQVSLPTDVYTFLKLHLDYLIGGVSLLRLKITQFIVENQNNTEKSNVDIFDCDLSSIKEEKMDPLNSKEKNIQLDLLNQMTTLTPDSDTIKFNVNANLGTSNIFNSVNSTKLDVIHNLHDDFSDVTAKKSGPFNNLMEKNQEPTFNKCVQTTAITLDSNDSLLNKIVNFNDSNINDCDKRKRVADNMNYDFSEIIEKKNKIDPFENWKGKGTNNMLNRFDWVINTDLNEVESEVEINLEPIQNNNEFSDKEYKLSSEIDNNHGSEDNDTHDKIENIKNYDICDDSLGSIKVKVLEDHDYSFKTSTPLDDKKQKTKLSAAIDQVARKKINSGKYFNDCPEMKLQNQFVKSEKKSDEPEKKTTKKKIFLLQNGNYCKAVTFKGCDWLPNNTCPFDTVVHMLFEGVLQDINFLKFCENSQNFTFKFLIDFKEHGPSDYIYKERFKILYPIYKNKEKNQGKIKKENEIAIPISRTIMCEDNINTLWTRLFADEPSIFERNSCATPNCQNNNINNLAVFPINYSKVIKHGFGSLQKALEFDSNIYNIRCNHCHGNKITRRQNPNFYIYIELDVKTRQEINGRKCKLRELPEYLTLPVTNEVGISHDFRYRISGVAGYGGFHYVAYCRRLSGLWICYNDLTNKPQSVTASQEILPHGILYIRSCSVNPKERT